MIRDAQDLNGAPGGPRSHDPALKRRLLYQLSYRGLCVLQRTWAA